jgi:hypothetical protein
MHTHTYRALKNNNEFCLKGFLNKTLENSQQKLTTL